jgi:peptidoglycan/LPS O-acetylase OafA/YrhL
MIFTLPSLLGINGLIRFTLDTKAFNFIAKISYCTYLIHLIIMYRWLTSIKIDFYYAYVPLFVLFVATTV